MGTVLLLKCQFTYTEMIGGHEIQNMEKQNFCPQNSLSKWYRSAEAYITYNQKDCKQFTMEKKKKKKKAKQLQCLYYDEANID